MTGWEKRRKRERGNDERREDTSDEDRGVGTVRRSRLRIEKGREDRSGGRKILESTFFFPVRRVEGAKTREIPRKSRLPSCVPHFDPRVHRRCDAMRSIIGIDHAEGGVGGGWREDWSREITLVIRFTRRSVRGSDFLLGLSWFQASSIFFSFGVCDRFITFQIRTESCFPLSLLHFVLFVHALTIIFLSFIPLDDFSWKLVRSSSISKM